MSRYLTPRALGLLALALLLIAVMVALGRWQFGAYADSQHAAVSAVEDQAPVALDEVLGPDAGFPADAVGRPVSAVGHYASDEQFYVRRFAGASGAYAVVTPLVTESGSAVLVVRGASDHLDATAPQGQVTVSGLLEPAQVDGGALDEHRVTDGIRIASLVPDIDQDLYSGYLISTSSQPADRLATVRPPAADPSRWAGIRNLIYALQWWVFAAFVAFMWWRVVQDADETTSPHVG